MYVFSFEKESSLFLCTCLARQHNHFPQGCEHTSEAIVIYRPALIEHCPKVLLNLDSCRLGWPVVGFAYMYQYRQIRVNELTLNSKSIIRTSMSIETNYSFK